MQNGGGLKESSEEHNRSKLLRGISKASGNISLISDARFKLPGGLVRGISSAPGARNNDESGPATATAAFQTQSYVFTLPDFSSFDDDFRKFLENDLIESSILQSLEFSGHLNWWTKECECEKLWPLSTSGDGNCLLHAASLGMWGFHDRLLILRKAVHLVLTKGVRRHALWRRWRWQQSRENKESGLIYSEKEWNREWENLVNLASSKPRIKASCSAPNVQDPATNKNATEHGAMAAPESTDVVYESLEELHVFALAHVLRRPIVIVSDTVLKNSGGEALSPVHFGGIYLPLECSSAECHKSPLVLCYGMAHFSALVAMQSPKSFCAPTIIPITTRDRELLPLHFAADPGPDFTWWEDEEDAKIAMFTDLSDAKKLELISEYMDLVKVPVVRNGDRFTFGGSGNSETSRFFTEDNQRRWNTIPLVRSVGNLYSGSTQTFSRLTKSVKQKLMAGYRSKKGEYDFMRISQNQKSEADLPKSVFLQMDSTIMRDVRSRDVVVGAKLYINLRSQFMEEMIENYLKAARKRFEGRKEGGGSGGGGLETTKRERLSRDFNAGVSAAVLFLRTEGEPPNPPKDTDRNGGSEHQLVLSSNAPGNGSNGDGAASTPTCDGLIKQSSSNASAALIRQTSNDSDPSTTAEQRPIIQSCSSLSDSYSDDLDFPTLNSVVDGSVVTVFCYDDQEKRVAAATAAAANGVSSTEAEHAQFHLSVQKTEKPVADGPLKIKYDVSSVTTSKGVTHYFVTHSA